MKLRTLLSVLSTICIAICIPVITMAQGDPGIDPDPVPLDGGLSLLIGAGIAYGAKKAYDKKKKDNKTSDENKEVS
ncbi:MAG: PID-CTERM protein-sorting domain-containing protein [Flavitalea sp.]